MSRFGRSYPIKSAVTIKTKVGRDYVVNVTDSVTPTETVTKTIQKAPITDSISLSESVVGLRVIPVSVSDTLTLIEKITKSITKAITENTTLTETITKVHSMFVSIADSISLVESLTYLRIILVTIIEKVPLFEKVYGYLNNILMIPWRSKYNSNGTSYTNKTQGQGTEWTKKYH